MALGGGALPTQGHVGAGPGDGIGGTANGEDDNDSGGDPYGLEDDSQSGNPVSSGPIQTPPSDPQSRAEQKQQENERQLSNHYKEINDRIRNNTPGSPFGDSNRDAEDTTGANRSDNDSPPNASTGPNNADTGDMGQSPYNPRGGRPESPLGPNQPGHTPGDEYGQINLGQSGPGGGSVYGQERTNEPGEKSAVGVPDSVSSDTDAVLTDTQSETDTVTGVLSDILKQQDNMGGDGSMNNRGDDGSGATNQDGQPEQSRPNAIQTLPGGMSPMTLGAIVVALAIGWYLL